MSSASNTAFAYMENSSPPPAYLLTYSVGGLKGAGESLAEYHRNSFDFFIQDEWSYSVSRDATKQTIVSILRKRQLTVKNETQGICIVK